MKIPIIMILIILALSALGCSDMPVVLPPIYTERQNINPAAPTQAVTSDKVTSNQKENKSEKSIPTPTTIQTTPSPSPTDLDNSYNGGD